MWLDILVMLLTFLLGITVGRYLVPVTLWRGQAPAIRVPAVKADARRCGRCGERLPAGACRTHDGRWRCSACKTKEANKQGVL